MKNVSPEQVLFVSYQCRMGSRTEGSWRANDDSLVLDLLGQIDLVAGGVLDQDVEVGDGVALLYERGRGAVEEGGLRANAGDVGCDTAGEHGFRLVNDGIGLIGSK